jgi:hypothetical protein
MSSRIPFESKEKLPVRLRMKSEPFKALEKWLPSDEGAVWVEANREIKSQAIRQLELLDAMHRELVEKAMKILEKAREDIHLHEIPIHAAKIRGKIYYLYDTPIGNRPFFSILEPQEYLKADPEARFIATYLLQEDNSWMRLGN